MPEFKHDYLLDVDVLGHIQLRPDSNEIYDAIIQGIIAGRIKTVRQVASGELKKFSEAYKALHTYHAQFEIAAASQFCPEVQGLIDQINELVPGLYEPFGSKNPDPADPWLIAVAKVHGFTLVTDENRYSPKRIPMACDRPELKCRCISGPHFLLETNIVPEINPEHIHVHSFYGIGT
jgi:hypothetical protein